MAVNNASLHHHVRHADRIQLCCPGVLLCAFFPPVSLDTVSSPTLHLKPWALGEGASKVFTINGDFCGVGRVASERSRGWRREWNPYCLFTALMHQAYELSLVARNECRFEGLNYSSKVVHPPTWRRAFTRMRASLYLSRHPALVRPTPMPPYRFPCTTWELGVMAPHRRR